MIAASVFHTARGEASQIGFNIFIFIPGDFCCLG